AAFKAGGKSSIVTILDANITTILAAAVLFIFGTSSIKGFATMLIVSILASFLTAVYGSRFFMKLWIDSGFLKNRKSWFGVKADQIQDINSKEVVEPTIFNKRVDIVKHRKKIFTLSTSLLIVGVIALSFLKLNPGIDFTSGSRVEVLGNDTIKTEEIEKEFEQFDLSPKSLVISGEKNEIAVLRFDSVLSESKMNEVKDFYIDKYD